MDGWMVDDYDAISFCTLNFAARENAYKRINTPYRFHFQFNFLKIEIDPSLGKVTETEARISQPLGFHRYVSSCSRKPVTRYTVHSYRDRE